MFSSPGCWLCSRLLVVGCVLVSWLSCLLAQLNACAPAMLEQPTLTPKPTHDPQPHPRTSASALGGSRRSGLRSMPMDSVSALRIMVVSALSASTLASLRVLAPRECDLWARSAQERSEKTHKKSEIPKSVWKIGRTLALKRSPKTSLRAISAEKFSKTRLLKTGLYK